MTTQTDSENKTLATCPECQKEHWIETITFPSGKVIDKALCPECLAEQKRQEQEETQHRKQAQLKERWQEICPPLYRQTDPARLPQDKLAEVLGWEYGPKGLFLIGPTGSGKTRAAYLLLRRLLEQDRRIISFDCAAFGHEVATRFRNGTGEDWAKNLAKVEIVFLDDMGKIPFTERAEAELFTLIERRPANLLPIIVTSNMTGRDMETKASNDRGAPMVRRLREFCHVIVFKKTDDCA